MFQSAVLNASPTEVKKGSSQGIVLEKQLHRTVDASPPPDAKQPRRLPATECSPAETPPSVGAIRSTSSASQGEKRPLVRRGIPRQYRCRQSHPSPRAHSPRRTTTRNSVGPRSLQATGSRSSSSSGSSAPDVRNAETTTPPVH